jgi:hypothetical protein
MIEQVSIYLTTYEVNQVILLRMQSISKFERYLCCEFLQKWRIAYLTGRGRGVQRNT